MRDTATQNYTRSNDARWCEQGMISTFAHFLIGKKSSQPASQPVQSGIHALKICWHVKRRRVNHGFVLWSFSIFRQVRLHDSREGIDPGFADTTVLIDMWDTWGFRANVVPACAFDILPPAEHLEDFNVDD